MLKAWPRSRRSILIQGEELSVGDRCVVIIQSLEDQVCEVSTEPVVVTSTEPAMVTLNTFVTTVVAVFIIAVLATVVVMTMIIILYKLIRNLK